MSIAHRYRVFGLTIESIWELPLLPAREGAEPDVRILDSEIEDGPEGLSITPQGSLLVIPSVARYRISGGDLIEVEALRNGSPRNVRLYLLGSAIGALLHQRGALPLHANAIDVGGAAVIFMGHSGAGKSTLAAWFHDKGYPVLADDICTVRISNGRVFACPGIPRLRLWRDALEHTGRSADSFEMSFDNYDKYDVPTSGPVADDPLPLIAVYHLATDLGVRKLATTRVHGLAGLDALMANTYRGSFLKMPAAIGQHVAQCLAVSRSVPIFRASRPWGAERD